MCTQFPSAERLRLMWPASVRRAPLAPSRFTRSDPARSANESLLFFASFWVRVSWVRVLSLLT